jgi:sulfoxide reductase heme-binding subunit YedZ
MTAPDPLDYGWWLASRAAGIVGYVLFSVAVLAGLTMASRLAAKPAHKRVLLQVHEHAALAGLIAVAIHGITLLGDAWLDPGPLGVAVPFVIDYRPVAVAAGIVSGYLAAALGLSFYIRRRIGAARWRRLHHFTLLAWLLGFLHALFAGTDAGSVGLQLVLLWTAGPIVVLLVTRVLAERRKRARARERAARSGAPQPRDPRPAAPA